MYTERSSSGQSTCIIRCLQRTDHLSSEHFLIYACAECMLIILLSFDLATKPQIFHKDREENIILVILFHKGFYLNNEQRI